MRRTRWGAVLACFLTAGVLSWVALDLLLRHRGWIPALTPWGAALALVVSVCLLIAGAAVRRLRERRATWITPTGAAATAAAAQSSALVGALIGGAYSGEAVLAVLAPSSSAMDALVWTAGSCALVSLVWCGVGMLVEHWCAIDMSDGDDDAPAVPPDGAPA